MLWSKMSSIKNLMQNIKKIWRMPLICLRMTIDFTLLHQIAGLRYIKQQLLVSFLNLRHLVLMISQPCKSQKHNKISLALQMIASPNTSNLSILITEPGSKIPKFCGWTATFFKDPGVTVSNKHIKPILRVEHNHMMRVEKRW